MHFGAALGLAAAVEEINHEGIDSVWAHNRRLTDSVVDGARSLGLRVASPIAHDDERSGIVSLHLPDGVECAPLVQSLQDDEGLLVTNRAGLLRVSPHFVNSEAEVSELVSALERRLVY